MMDVPMTRKRSIWERMRDLEEEVQFHREVLRTLDCEHELNPVKLTKETMVCIPGSRVYEHVTTITGWAMKCTKCGKELRSLTETEYHEVKAAAAARLEELVGR